MRQLYLTSLKVFIRSRGQGAPFVLLQVLIMIYLVYCFHNYVTYREVFSTMIWLVRPNILIIAFLIYCGYQLAATIQDNHMIEYLATYRQGLLKVYGAFILSLVTLTSIPAIMMSTFALVIYFFSDINYTPLFHHFLKLSALYFGMSFLVAIVLGVLLAAKFRGNRLKVYSSIITLVLLNTTFTDVPFRIPRLLFDSYLVEQILYNIKDYFTLVPHELGSNFAIIPMYGFPMEPIRWVMALFWLLFSVIVILTECFVRKTTRRPLVILGYVLVLLSITAFSVRGSTLAMDRRVESFAYADPFYYLNNPNERFEPGIAFSVDKYDISLAVGNELHAEVIVTVSDPNLAHYDFTLYHGYKLKRVYDETGDIPFARVGDHIRVWGRDGSSIIGFSYSGTSPKFYANSQAIALPGYFAYYPKPGLHQIWDWDQYGYVVNTSPEESHFDLQVRSNLRIFSNLEGTDKAFSGNANAVSVFAGMYEEVEPGIFAEPLRDELAGRECLLKADAILSDVFQQLGLAQPAATQALSNKKLFLLPRSFSLNSNTDEIVIMSDHITTVACENGHQLALMVVESLLTPHPHEKVFMHRMLGYLFQEYDDAITSFNGGTDLQRLLRDVTELRSISQKHLGITQESVSRMSAEERQAFEIDQRRSFELGLRVQEQAARYLFYESPKKEYNFQLFVTFFMSRNEMDCFSLIETILKEDLEI